MQRQIQIIAASSPTADGGLRLGEEDQGFARLQAGGQQGGEDRGPQDRGRGHGTRASGPDKETFTRPSGASSGGPETWPGIKEEVASDVGESAEDLAAGKRKWSDLPVHEEVVVREDSQV